MNTLLIFFLNRIFLDIVEKNQEPVFLNQRVSPISVFNDKWRAKFQIYRLHKRKSDWSNFILFSGYKDKNRLVSILRKRKDHALISIFTILKLVESAPVDNEGVVEFSALATLQLLRCLRRPKLNLWEVADWEITHLGSCYLGYCHLGSRHWEDAFENLHNT